MKLSEVLSLEDCLFFIAKVRSVFFEYSRDRGHFVGTFLFGLYVAVKYYF